MMEGVVVEEGLVDGCYQTKLAGQQGRKLSRRDRVHSKNENPLAQAPFPSSFPHPRACRQLFLDFQLAHDKRGRHCNTKSLRYLQRGNEIQKSSTQVQLCKCSNVIE